MALGSPYSGVGEGEGPGLGPRGQQSCRHSPPPPGGSIARDAGTPALRARPVQQGLPRTTGADPPPAVFQGAWHHRAPVLRAPGPPGKHQLRLKTQGPSPTQGVLLTWAHTVCSQVPWVFCLGSEQSVPGDRVKVQRAWGSLDIGLGPHLAQQRWSCTCQIFSARSTPLGALQLRGPVWAMLALPAQAHRSVP